MKSRHQLIFSALALVVAAGSPGCGFFMPNNGAVRVKVDPPAAAPSLRTKVVPSNTMMVTVAISGEGLNAPLAQSVTFTSGPTAQTFNFDSVPVGTKIVQATAYSDLNSQNIVAQSDPLVFEVTSGTSTIVPVTMNPTSLAASPTPTPTATATATATATPTPAPTVSATATPTPTPTPSNASGVSGQSGTAGGAGTNGQTSAGGGAAGL